MHSGACSSRDLYHGSSNHATSRARRYISAQSSGALSLGHNTLLPGGTVENLSARLLASQRASIPAVKYRTIDRISTFSRGIATFILIHTLIHSHMGLPLIPRFERLNYSDYGLTTIGSLSNFIENLLPSPEKIFINVPCYDRYCTQKNVCQSQ